jgi:translocation and assembly module TamA
MASAFDLFDWFGSDEPPQPSPTTLPYKIEFVVNGDDGVKYALLDSSNFLQVEAGSPA